MLRIFLFVYMLIPENCFAISQIIYTAQFNSPVGKNQMRVELYL